MNKSNITVNEVKELMGIETTATSELHPLRMPFHPAPTMAATGLKYKNTTSRKDAQDLEEWMNEMTTKLVSDT